MDPAHRVERLVEPALAAMGYDLVRVQLSGKKHVTLQIMAEHADGTPMTVDDCAAISRNISAILDVEDPVSGAYDLEVSSPGIDRPLVRERDFERYAGFDVRIELQRPIDGRKRFKGKLMGLDGDAVKLAVGNDTIGLPYSDIHKAKLVLTDDLIKGTESQRQS
jgi:ribosome maturation factor RimP